MRVTYLGVCVCVVVRPRCHVSVDFLGAVRKRGERAVGRDVRRACGTLVQGEEQVCPCLQEGYDIFCVGAGLWVGSRGGGSSFRFIFYFFLNVLFLSTRCRTTSNQKECQSGGDRSEPIVIRPGPGVAFACHHHA